MRRSLIRSAAIALALAVVPAASAWAQGVPTNGAPTRAGTEIKNKATATFTDANGNAYAPVVDSVSLTVARITGVDIRGPAVNPTPESPSTGNIIEYILTNRGNEFDEFKLNVTAGAGITVTGFALDTLNGPWYNDLAAFNAVLADTSVDYTGNNGKAGVGLGVGTPNDSTLKVYLRYDLAPDFDPDEKLEVEVESKEDPDTKDKEETTYDPVYKREILVKAQGGAQSRLPSGNPEGPNPLVEYTAVFTVENKASGKDFDWALAVTGPDASKFTIVSVDGGADLANGTGGSTNGTLELAYGATMTVTVTYTVATDAAAGRQEDIKLTVTSRDDADVSDVDTINVTVIRPALSIAKAAFADDAGTALAPGGVAPGATVWYRITVTNTNVNGAEAANVVITDELPDALEYISSKSDAGNVGTWEITTSTNATGLATTVTIKPVDGDNDQRAMATGETAIFWIEVKVR